MIPTVQLHLPKSSHKSAPKRRMVGVALWIIAIALALALSNPTPKEASAVGSFAPLATITVDRTDDNVAASACTAAANDCSLRGAIIFANANPGTTITIPAGTYTLSITGSDNAALQGDLDINANVTINGAGSATTIITTNYTNTCGDCKVFGINQDGTHDNLVVSITGVTIKNGYNTGDGTCTTFVETGGGVDLFMTGAAGSLTMSDVIITNNKTAGCPSSYGGGINIDGLSPNAGTISFTNVQVISNTADATGGGINFFGESPALTINATSVISGNTTLGPSGLGGNGGGINIRTTSGGSVAIHGTTIANNTSKGTGGGIDIAGANKASVTIDNTGGASSLMSNRSQNNGTSASQGGGLSKDDGTTTASLTNVTISGNHADNQGTAGASPQGGGLFTTGSGGAVNMTGGSISNNTSNDTTNNKGNGGGAAVTQTGGTVHLTGVTISGNRARVDGGGVYLSGAGGTTTLDGATTLSSNSATNGNGGGVNAFGGTVNLKPTNVMTVTANTAVNGGGIAVVGGTANITYSNFITNTGSTQGGALFLSSGSLTMNYSRIKGNTSAGATGLRVSGGTVSNITNNWWACNGDPSMGAAGCDLVTGTLMVNPRLQLHHSASPSTLLLGATSMLTADFLTNSSGAPISVSNLKVLIGLPITFNNAVNGSLSGAQSTIQSTGSATATFTATGCNTGNADATVDNGTATVSITIPCTFLPLISK